MNSTYICTYICHDFREIIRQRFREDFANSRVNYLSNYSCRTDSTWRPVCGEALTKLVAKHAKLPLTDDVQLEEILQVRVRQGRVLSATLQDPTVIIRDGREDQRAEDHRGIAALHRLLAYAKIEGLRVIRKCRDRVAYPEALIIDLAVPECLVPLDPGDTGAGMRACRLARDGVVLLRLHDRQLRQDLHGERFHWNRPNGSSLPRVIALRGNSRTFSFPSRGSSDRESRGDSSSPR